MSKRLPPSERNPTPLMGPNLIGYTIGDWCDSQDGSGKPVAVGLSLEIRSKGEAMNTKKPCPDCGTDSGYHQDGCPRQPEPHQVQPPPPASDQSEQYVVCNGCGGFGIIAIDGHQHKTMCLICNGTGKRRDMTPSARDQSDPLSHTDRELIAFHADPGATEPTTTTRLANVAMTLKHRCASLEIANAKLTAGTKGSFIEDNYKAEIRSNCETILALTAELSRVRAVVGTIRDELQASDDNKCGYQEYAAELTKALAAPAPAADGKVNHAD